MVSVAVSTVFLTLAVPTPADIPKLVAHLAAPDFRTREAAGRHLFAVGERALPILRKERAFAHHPEVVERLDAVIARLDAERLANPTRISYRGESVLGRAAVDAIRAQSGYALNADAATDALTIPVTVDWDRVPFWQALDDVCRQCELAAVPGDDIDPAVVLRPADTVAPYVAYSGPFRFVAAGVSARRDVILSGLPRNQPPLLPAEQLSLTFHVHAEPKAPLVGLRRPTFLGGDALDRPTTDDGPVPVVPFLFRGFSQTAAIPMARTNRAATQSREIRGRVELVVLTETRPDAVVDLTGPRRTASGKTADITVTAVQKSAVGVTVTLTAKPKFPPADPYAWANTVYQRLDVTDDRGRRWPAGPVADQQIDATGATLTLSFAPPPGDPPGDPRSLTLSEWVTQVRLVPFAFRDVPLP